MPTHPRKMIWADEAKALIRKERSDCIEAGAIGAANTCGALLEAIDSLQPANGEVERWREEAFISLTHCEAVGADKAAAMFRTLLSRMGVEEAGADAGE